MIHILFDLENIRETYKPYLIHERDKLSSPIQLYKRAEAVLVCENDKWLMENKERFYVRLCPRLCAAILATIKPLRCIHENVVMNCPINFMVTGFHTAADVVYYANCMLEYANYSFFGYIKCMNDLIKEEKKLTYQERLARYTESIQKTNNAAFHGYSPEYDISSLYTVNYWFDQFETLYKLVVPISEELTYYLDNPHLAADADTVLEHLW